MAILGSDRGHAAPPGVARSMLPLLAAVFVAASLSAVRPTPVAAAQTALSFTSDSRWTVDTANARVHVLAVIRATSHAAAIDGLATFYDSVELSLPPSIADLQAATMDGIRLSPIIAARRSSGTIIDLPFGQRLYSGDSATVAMSFDLVDQGGSTDRSLRIGRNLMSFPVLAFGSPGTGGSTVTVVFPGDLTVQKEFGPLVRSSSSGGSVVYSSGIVDDSTTLSAWFTAMRPVSSADYRIRSVVLGKMNVTLRYWVDDPGWADQVERVMAAGYPVMREMIGLQDPGLSDLTVVEATGEESSGFAGSFNQTIREMQISYLADPFVILHELAHLWFNQSLAPDRWIDEAFASYYAEQVVVKLGYADHAPILTDRLLDAAVPFNDWNEIGDPTSSRDAYLYAATLAVADQIATQAGQDGLRRVWQAQRAGRAAYQPVSGPKTEIIGPQPLDWRRFLDLLEQATGRSYTTIWQRWVVDSGQSAQLQRRSDILVTYQSAQALAGTWNMPIQIRRALDAWKLDEAQGLILQARAVLTQRAQIEQLASEQQTKPPVTLRVYFETGSLPEAATEAGAELGVLRDIGMAADAQAKGNPGGPAFRLIGSDPAADLAAARRAFTAGDLKRADQLAVGAREAFEGGTTGLIRFLGSMLGLFGLLLLAVVVWFMRRHAMPLPGAARLAAAATALGAWFDATPRRRDAAGKLRGLAAAIVGAARAVHDRVGRVVKRGSVKVRRGWRTARGERRLERMPAATPAATPADADGSPSPESSVAAVPDTHLDESAYDLLQRGQALLDDRHNAQAAVVLERAARLAPGKGSILEALGRAYFNSGQHERAADAFKALLEVDPSAHYGHFGLALSFSRLGRKQEARTHLRLATALDPSSETYRKALERIDRSMTRS